MRALAIVRRDLLRYLRNPVRTALLFSTPLVVAAIFVAVFGGGGSRGNEVTITILLFDEDQSLFGRLLQGAASSSQADGRLDLVAVGEEGHEMMERGEASALIHLPEGFTADFLAGRATTIDLVKNPAQRFLPRVVEEGVSLAATLLATASRVLRPELDRISALTESDAAPSDAVVATISTGFNATIRQLERYLFPPVLTFTAGPPAPEAGGVETEETSTAVAILSLMLPGLSVMGILFVAQSASRDILRDREQGLVRHLLTTPASVADYLLGKSLSTLLVTTLGFAVLVAVGAAAGMSWGAPVAATILVVATSVAVSGTLLLIMSMVTSERQGDAVTTIVIISWSLLGGAFVPVSQIPAGLRPVSASTAVFWATDGFTRLIAGGGLGDITLNVVILTTAGALFLALGNFFLHRRLTGGSH